MNQFVFAVVALLAVASVKVSARPGYGNNGYSAPSYRAPYAAPFYGPAYSSPPYSSLSYPAPYRNQLQPVAIQNNYGNYNSRYAAPSPLYAAPSNPSASSSSAASNSGLPAGRYAQLAVPAYEFLSGDQLNYAGGLAAPVY